MLIEKKENKLLIKNRYRPEIDGLRGFAVLTVIVNHFDKGLLPGGYLGVDIFFVMPKSYTIETLPKPNGSNVQLSNRQKWIICVGCGYRGSQGIRGP